MLVDLDMQHSASLVVVLCLPVLLKANQATRQLHSLEQKSLILLDRSHTTYTRLDSKAFAHQVALALPGTLEAILKCLDPIPSSRSSLHDRIKRSFRLR